MGKYQVVTVIYVATCKPSFALLPASLHLPRYLQAFICLAACKRSFALLPASLHLPCYLQAFICFPTCKAGEEQQQGN